MIKRLRAIIGLAIALFVTCAAAQDDWPARPVRVVVPSSPGGGTDLYARLLAQALTESLKQQFVVDNRPGASGNIGAEIAARATPNGYTLLVSANPALTINPTLFRKLPYNAERDFVAIARGVIGPAVLCVNPALPVKTLADLLALGKREPGTLAFGSAGIGSPTYLGVVMLEEASGAKFLHVPYKGVGPAYQDLLAGQIKFMLPDLASVLPHIKAGKAVPLAVTQSTPLLPGTPTIAQAGYPTVEVITSFSVVAPTGTPRAIVQRLSAEIVKAMKAPWLAERLESQALIPVFDTPEQAAAGLKAERERWAAFIRRNGIVQEQ